SPFEAMVFTFEIKCPIFIARQWHRHRTWCLAAGTPLIFTRPDNGRPNPMTIGELVRKWHAPRPKRARGKRTLAEFNRERIGRMTLRSPAGDVHVKDAWFSGEKEVYVLKTRHGTVEASADHRVQTPDGWKTIGENPSHVMAMIRVGDPRDERKP